MYPPNEAGWNAALHPVPIPVPGKKRMVWPAVIAVSTVVLAVVTFSFIRASS